MLIKRTKIIPAKPAEPERTEEKTVRLCDICQKHYWYRECLICNRDVCKSCSLPDPTNLGDYPGTWCRRCMELWQAKYKAQDKVIEATADAAYETMRAVWKAESLATGRKP